MTWTIITCGVCAAWLVYEYRTAPIIESLDGMTGNECQCHGLNGINSNHDGELRRATEGISNGRFHMVSDRHSGGFAGYRILGVDCVARYRGGHWEVGLWNGHEKFMYHQRSQLNIRKKIARLATDKHLSWEEAAGLNCFLMKLESEVWAAK